MKQGLLFFSFLMAVSGLRAQQNYPAVAIPKELLSYASAVIRYQETNVEVKDFDNVLTHTKLAITVLNKNGEDAAHLAVFYNKSMVIKSIKGLMYDEFGKQIDKFSESNFEDQYAEDGFSLFQDIRVKHYVPPISTYPYTVVYDYEVKEKQSLMFETWVPQETASTAVEKSVYTFTCKPDFNIRYKETNIPAKAAITENAGLKTYTWQMSNIKAYRPEPYSPNREVYTAELRIAPEKFEYQGVRGSFTTWNELGKWQYDKLLMNRQAISGETAQYITQLVAGISDVKQKAKKIYEYMQAKTHYVSVQVGIGGYQPFLASDVDKLSYGDCKGLVNYTQSLLKLAGIDSYYCVVKSGDQKISIIPDFPSMNQGDHVILCLPFKNDTTWLECTSQKTPFGYLGDFTDDRWVLACTPQGGKLMHTPKYGAAGNSQIRKANFILNGAGELTGNMTTTFKGLQYDDRERFMDESPVERNKMIQHTYGINNLTVDKLEITQDKSLQPVTTENLQFSAYGFGTENNGQLRFVINPVDHTSATPRDVRNRVNDVYINDGYTYEDEITYKLPQGYLPPLTHLNVLIEKPFGNYHVTTSYKDGKLVYNRKLQIIDGTYKKELYDDLVNFYEKVNETDRLGISLTKGAN